MRKLCIVSVFFLLLSSCSNSTTNDEAKDNRTDGGAPTNPTGIDTVKHPSGVDNSSVISTDTAAMNVQNTIKKADSLAKQQNK